MMRIPQVRLGDVLLNTGLIRSKSYRSTNEKIPVKKSNIPCQHKVWQALGVLSPTISLYSSDTLVYYPTACTKSEDAKD
jgi:macrodomain Ter protein organizer (MatP/YcbG family)